MQDYLRCILAIDENVGRLREHITERGDHEQTLTIYGADHGFFLGEHGWFDKRFMYEPSMRIPLVMAYPRKVPAGWGAYETSAASLDILVAPLRCIAHAAALTGPYPHDYADSWYSTSRVPSLRVVTQVILPAAGSTSVGAPGAILLAPIRAEECGQ